MKIRTTKYIIREGTLNTHRNKLMSLASVSIVTASFIILGIFLLITFNLNYNMRVLSQQPEMEVFCTPDLDDKGVSSVEDAIKQSGLVSEYTRVSKEEAFEKVKKILGENSNLLEGENEDFLPVSFVVKLKNSQQSQDAVNQFKKIPGVENIAYSQDTVQFISEITYWVRIISTVLIFILLVISILIISNTIKLTVFARRKEINIMKYIGATDWFIRWPFIVEGAIIGVLGACIAFVLTAYGYGELGNKINTSLVAMKINFFKFVTLKEVGLSIAGIYASAGIAIGSLGSMISIRKYLHV